MNRNKRLLLSTLVIAMALGLVTASLALASSPTRSEASESFLSLISEETGMMAAETAVSAQCTYSTEYALYLCPEAPPTQLPQPDAAAHAHALHLLGLSGLLLVPESTYDRVMAFDPVTGNLVDADFIPADITNLSTPIHAILGPDNNSILVSDQIVDAVQEYDFDGNFIGTFAGGDVNILDNIRGIALRPNGNLLVTVGGGTNDDAVAEFDTNGAYLGNFIANGSGGLDSPFDALDRTNDWLVGGITSDALHRYDLAGTYLDNLTAINSFPEQLGLASNDNILVANFSGTQEGVVEYTSAGALVGIYDPATLGGYRGIYELPNGNILTTNGSGVHEIDRNGNLVETKIAGVNARFIEFIPTESASIELVKTVGTDPQSCATTTAITTTQTTDFTYCYTITNSGNVTLTNHDLLDDQLGQIFAGLTYTLTPGSSVFVTATTFLSQTTVNSATWTASNTVYTATASATANVFIVAPSIIVSKTVGTDASSCASTNNIAVEAGITVFYCYTVTNTGDIALLSHDLVDDQLGTIFTGFAYDLAPGASLDSVAAGLTISDTVTNSITNLATWTASNNGITATATATASVVVVNPSITMSKTVGTEAASCASSNTITIEADTIVYYCYTVTNTGDVTLYSHDLVDDQLGVIFTNCAYTLTPGASIDTVAAGLTLSDTITSTTINTATWTAYNAKVVTATAVATATVTVGADTSYTLYLPFIAGNP
jgi:hypothetical protein